MAKKLKPVKRQPLATGSGLARANRRRMPSFLCAVGALVIGTVIYFWPQPKLSELPPLKLEGVDPAIVKMIEDARSEIKKSPRSGPAWGKLAIILGLHDFVAEADVAFANAEQLEPREPRWPYIRGLTRSGENAETAFASFERAAKLCGDVPAPRLRYAETLIERGRLDEAAAQIRRVFERDPRDARALLGLGRIAFARGQWPESLDFLRRSIEATPNVRASHALLATVQQRLGDKAAAAESLRRAATASDAPEWPDPFLYEANQYRAGKNAATDIAAALLKQGRDGEALTLLQRTTRAYPDYLGGWLALGKLSLQMKDPLAAESALRKAVKLEPTSVDAQVELGSALFARGNYGEAEACYREAIRIKPNLAEAHFNLGLALMNQQNNPAAIESFQTATRYKPDLTYAYIRWGQALGRLHRGSEAIEQFRQALRLSPDNLEAREMLDILLRSQNPPPPPK